MLRQAVVQKSQHTCCKSSFVKRSHHHLISVFQSLPNRCDLPKRDFRKSAWYGRHKLFSGSFSNFFHNCVRFSWANTYGERHVNARRCSDCEELNRCSRLSVNAVVKPLFLVIRAAAPTRQLDSNGKWRLLCFEGHLSAYRWRLLKRKSVSPIDGWVAYFYQTFPKPASWRLQTRPQLSFDSWHVARSTF